MEKKLTEKELKQREKDVKKAIELSENIVNDFNIYLGVYRAENKAQVSLLTNQEYEDMLFDPSCDNVHISNFVNKFKITHILDTSTLVIDKSNFALAFNPIVWAVLKLEQKIAVCRIASMAINNKDVTQFHNSDSNGFVWVGDDYGGAFNIGAFFRDDVDSLKIFADICDLKNIINYSYYFNKHYNKEENYYSIKNFESFEELQYVSPLELNKELKESSSEAQAFFWDELYRRNSRSALLKSLDMLSEASLPIQDISQDMYKYIKAATKDIVNTNIFVAKELGSNIYERDKKYLKIKVDIFNNLILKDYNEKVVEHNQLVEEYKNTENQDKKSEIFDKISNIKAELQAIKSNTMTYEEALEKFNEYFKKEKRTYYRNDDKELC